MELIKNNEEILRQKCQSVSVKEGRKIAKDMFSFLKEYNRQHEIQGIGLAAPQLGIFKKVCILLVKNNIFLVNPIIIRHSAEKIEYDEACLSFPGQKVKTLRHWWVDVKADNIGEKLTYFGPKDFSIIKDNKDKITEAVAAQHEICHLYSDLFFDHVIPESP